MFRTALCDLLGIEHPILQSGMGNIAGPDLVAEVSSAGGLGILAGLNVPPDVLRDGIREVRKRTSRPFGVNLWLHETVESPVDVATIPDTTVAGAQRELNRYRERLGIPTTSARPATLPALLPSAIDVILEERVPVFSTALVRHHHAELVQRCHARGVKVVTMVTTVDAARAAAASGVDVIVAQGGEAGGHRSVGDKPASAEAVGIGTMALVPQIVDAVQVPVVAAGGIADGRGLVAALALGATGVLLGTRFVASREATVPEFWKKALLEHESDATAITDVFTGLWARALRNTMSEEYRTSGAPVLPPLVQRAAAFDVYAASAKQQNREYYPMFSGQSVGLIHDLPGAGEVVATIMREAQDVLAALPRRANRG
ncbi:MAG: nitronate monooxygenase [Candidatus Rokuibacteriota bacterium]|nr:MAG: nitronate monooxygenase [Candidatus Rokubacteria bacterium]